MNNLYLVNDKYGEIGWMSIVAPTRGRAKVLYLSLSGCDHEDAWLMPVSIQLLAKDVELPEGEDATVTDDIYFESVEREYYFEYLGYRMTDRYYGKKPSGYYGS